MENKTEVAVAFLEALRRGLQPAADDRSARSGFAGAGSRLPGLAEHHPRGDRSPRDDGRTAAVPGRYADPRRHQPELRAVAAPAETGHRSDGGDLANRLRSRSRDAWQTAAPSLAHDQCGPRASGRCLIQLHRTAAAGSLRRPELSAQVRVGETAGAGSGRMGTAPACRLRGRTDAEAAMRAVRMFLAAVSLLASVAVSAEPTPPNPCSS